MSSNFKYLLAILSGGSLGFFLWIAILAFIEDKPVPNAIFTQSIIDSKLEAARGLEKFPKTVFVGGSNVLFGVDSKLFSEITNKPALNFGCAAGMGPELILDLLKPYLNEGDLVVMRWEYGQFNFTRSGEVNLTYLNLLAGPQRNFKKLLPLSDQLKLSMTIPFSHVRDSIFTHYNSYVSPDIYSCPWSIDQLGNIRGNKDQNLSSKNLGAGHPSILRAKGISTDAENIFLQFVKFCKNNGVYLVSSWPNTLLNTSYLESEIALKRFREIGKFWASLGIKVVGAPADYMFEQNLFFDSTYHLNANGIRKCTLRLADQLKPTLTSIGRL